MRTAWCDMRGCAIRNAGGPCARPRPERYTKYCITLVADGYGARPYKAYRKTVNKLLSHHAKQILTLKRYSIDFISASISFTCASRFCSTLFLSMRK